MSENDGGFMAAATPVFGVVAGTIAATKGADMLVVPAKWAPWGVAAIGAVGALAADGWVRDAAIGVAAAGAGLGILRMMGMLDPSGHLPTHRNAPAAEAPAQEQAKPPAPDLITRDELQKALAETVQQHENRMKEVLQENLEQVRQLRSAYDARIEHLCGRYDQLLAECWRSRRNA